MVKRRDTSLIDRAVGGASSIRVFLSQSWRDFRHVGAVAPSGACLARAMTRHLKTLPTDRPWRILEAGPGTGAMTREILNQLRTDDRLVIVESNATFANHARRLLNDGQEEWPAAANAVVIEGRVEAARLEGEFDWIVSSLPFNNFTAAEVAAIFDVYRLRAPSGRLSFFEYLGVRGLKGLVANHATGRRLGEVAEVLRGMLVGREFARETVWRNLPPAVAHHLRLDAPRERTDDSET